MRTDDFSYDLPEQLIAQEPLPRGTSRLLVLDRRTGRIEHDQVSSLPQRLQPGDLLLLNDTRVIPARLFANRPTGRRFELLLLRQHDQTRWQALLRPSSRARTGERLQLGDGGVVILAQRLDDGQWLLDAQPPLDAERLDQLGETPLPPYISRPHGATPADRDRYQTVYAREPGAVAAPTAGLHLTPELLEAMPQRGVEIAYLTLHVGIGTFRPVSADLVAEHTMHEEQYLISPATAAAISRARAAGRRIVCVGTTSVRALEGALATGNGTVVAGSAATDIFITPGYTFAGAGALLTNFHLPRSTLLMLVSAFAGREQILATYHAAVQQRYRFFSYGDAMLIT